MSGGEGVAFVSGAGSGIGQATSVEFAAAGRTVVGCDLNEAGLEETGRLCAGGTGTFVAAVADVTDSAAVDRAVATAAGHGRLDAAVNAAGIVGPTLKLGEGDDSSRLRDVSDADWDRVLAINLSGVFNCVRAQMRAMWEEGGAIVNLASIAGLVGTAGLGPYVASKHGVVGLGKAAALEGAPRGIRVNTVCPGTVATPMLLEAFGDDPEQTTARDAATPLGRPAEPGELAATCVWLCGDGASYITGAALPVDGGTTSMNPRSGVARKS
ncbi:MAG TPA: SDR family NAD(P)-dependent oxidoreductase [Solirubrobacterales bacterium]|nr:SDR family NAD(P)-dependent oxidoreductase [Solirubrobacterales bacterium]